MDEGGSRSRVSMSVGALEGGGGSFTGEPGGCVKEGSGDGHLSPYRPHWGTWKGAHILGTLNDD
jgi:hypothetical protein